jgi:hypothetical protein
LNGEMEISLLKFVEVESVDVVNARTYKLLIADLDTEKHRFDRESFRWGPFSRLTHIFGFSGRVLVLLFHLELAHKEIWRNCFLLQVDELLLSISRNHFNSFDSRTVPR